MYIYKYTSVGRSMQKAKVEDTIFFSLSFFYFFFFFFFFSDVIRRRRLTLISALSGNRLIKLFCAHFFFFVLFPALSTYGIELVRGQRHRRTLLYDDKLHVLYAAPSCFIIASIQEKDIENAAYIYIYIYCLGVSGI